MSSWKTFLESQGAHWDELGSVNFEGAPAPSEGATLLVDLSYQRLLTVTGPDAAKFLQGQVTCDINALGPVSRLGAHCNHKGRALSSFRAVQLAADQIVLRMHGSVLAGTQQTLGKYIVFSKAELKDASEDYRRIGLAGPKAEALILHQFGECPQADQDVTLHEHGCVIKISANRYECWIKPEQGESLWQQLATDCTAVGSAAWTWLDIRDGLGEVRAQSVEEFIPQMLNFQAIGGISFNKGCYTGQEVVARMQYLGKMKRQMFRVTLSGGALPQPSDHLYSDTSKQSVGNVVMAAANPVDEKCTEALAVITKAAVEADSVFLDENHQQKLQVLDLPYAINKDDEE